jgi:hypothetical protein
MEPLKPNSLKKQMGHNLPQKEGLYHPKILVIKLDASLRGLENTPMILDPLCRPHTYIIFPSKPTKRDKKEERRGIICVR